MKFSILLIHTDASVKLSPESIFGPLTALQIQALISEIILLDCTPPAKAGQESGVSTDFVSDLPAPYRKIVRCIRAEENGENPVDRALALCTGAYVYFADSTCAVASGTFADLAAHTGYFSTSPDVLSLNAPCIDNESTASAVPVNPIDRCPFGYFIRRSLLLPAGQPFASPYLAVWEKVFRAFLTAASFADIPAAVCRMRYGNYSAVLLDALLSGADALQSFVRAVFDTAVHNAATSGALAYHNQYNLFCLLLTFFNNEDRITALLSEQQRKSVKQSLNAVFGLIDDAIYARSNTLKSCQLNYILSQKYACSPKLINIPAQFDGYFVNGIMTENLRSAITNIQFIRLDKDEVYIEGTTNLINDRGGSTFFFTNNGKRTNCKLRSYDNQFEWFGDVLQTARIFSAAIPLNRNTGENRIELFGVFEGVTVQRKRLTFGKFSPVAKELDNSYYADNGWIVRSTADALTVRGAGKLSATRAEAKLFFSLLFSGKRIKIKAAAIRLLCRAAKFFLGKKRIWLVSDRINRGDDNGEAFFKYCMQNTQRFRKKKIYFVIEKTCPDYRRIRKIGPVVHTLSLRHKLLHVISEYVISSQANNPVVNPLLKMHIFYRDMLAKSKFVFLQHGITKDNQSAWLNKYNRNIHGLIVTTRPEYDSCFEYPYYYSEQEIWLTGMPRYDLLCHDEQKLITIMPTWRKSLTNGSDPATGIWNLADGFDESAYFRFYNTLINNERLLSAVKRHGCRLSFVPHPIFAPHADRFDRHPDVEFCVGEKTYREIFAQTNLLLTDYSSVAFDFAYLRKPIVYAHFDRDTFFSGTHSYTEGYFDYERDGFGEVELTLDATIDRLIAYVENNFAVSEKYIERINRTFAFDDRNCCERVAERLLK
ncbi:MAG: CDP-glycerol glycerophosphotransferase family protein [Oscillospiraceae bacterium]